MVSVAKPGDFVEVHLGKLIYEGTLLESPESEKGIILLKLGNGYNVGFNFGEAAGQTIPHFHLHVIPRFYNDIENPSGGIRNVIPGKGNYFR